MRIGELSKATGVDVETIRYYEKAQLLSAPTRSDNVYFTISGIFNVQLSRFEIHSQIKRARRHHCWYLREDNGCACSHVTASTTRVKSDKTTVS